MNYIGIALGLTNGLIDDGMGVGHEGEEERREEGRKRG